MARCTGFTLLWTLLLTLLLTLLTRLQKTGCFAVWLENCQQPVKFAYNSGLVKQATRQEFMLLPPSAVCNRGM